MNFSSVKIVDYNIMFLTIFYLKKKTFLTMIGEPDVGASFSYSKHPTAQHDLGNSNYFDNNNFQHELYFYGI